MVQRQRALSQARALFNEQGVLPSGLVAEPILRSWRRCAEWGIDMRAARVPEPLTAAELRQARQRNEMLRRVAEPALASLRGAGGIIILTDAQGLVLDCEGDTGFAERARRVALMPGASWGESAAGTNAIGTALAEGRALVVQGAEHYLESNRILTCMAVPVFDGQGRSLGVLDFSCQTALARAGLLEQVRAAADAMEHALFEADFERHERLHLEGGAMLAFDGERLAGANRQARALLGLDSEGIGRLRYADLFDGDPALGAVRTRQGAALRLRASHGRRPPAAPAPAVPPGVHFEPATLAALDRAVRLCDAGLSVLLQGETGAGKEMFARALHARSRRARGPFVAINCAALPESLIESELFGYEEGAFTGARRQGSKGLLRQAHGGVLFLDEIGDMPLALQARLLRVLQSREVTPLGGGKPVDVDFALVCATHRPLANGQGDAPVRADLYFRIAEYTVALPALRERADLPALVRQMWQAQAGPALPPALADELAAYAWPGNYRQLNAVLRTLRVLAAETGVVERAMLPADVRGSVAAPGDLASVTGGAIDAALAAHGGNVSRAARALGVHRSTLYRRRAH
ncbi:sigma-54-dependent Fis family transcriptional regulator [Bordetella genomosp. 12]|uniref:Sigma-54-dependent Fis family transcriptional regulator n=1 Tax=Bordetella genomosp. 12 TaxID=463035 RepID=A0A261VX53_9BORD|nr:sigma-54-dependent Fis family transcriptional regulator [Bordetella genomosp. 12]OZI77873.1 sigma-54-dependent Fis family transcriptional regulator [Bordetella genomosp. 12]